MILQDRLQPVADTAIGSMTQDHPGYTVTEAGPVMATPMAVALSYSAVVAGAAEAAAFAAGVTVVGGAYALGKAAG